MMTSAEANTLQTRQCLEDERDYLTELLLRANLARDEATQKAAQEELERVKAMLRAA